MIHRKTIKAHARYAGKKGLWWHQHQKHTIEYAEAVTVASSSINDLAIVPYDRINVGMLRVLDEETAPQRNGNRPFKQCNTIPIELVKNGNLVGLKEAVNVSKFCFTVSSRLSP